MQGPVGEGQLQQSYEAIERVVNGYHLAKVGEPKEGSKDGKVAAVQHESPHSPQNQSDYLSSTALDCISAGPLVGISSYLRGH